VNPLLGDWTAPYGLPPFEAIQAEHFEPALRQAMAEHLAELAAIAANPAAPDFDNTLASFDRAGVRLAAVASVFHNLAASATSDALQAVQRAMAGPLAEHDSAVFMDAALFARVSAVFAGREALAPEQRRLVERVYDDFVRAGARLAPADQVHYAALMSDLARLNTRFAQNVLHDEASFHLHLKDEADLAGLPEFVRTTAQQAAAERGLAGWAITLSRSSVVPFLTFSQRRDLREAAWRAWVGRGEHPGENDNRETIRDILRLRHEQAALHGQPNFAAHALTDTMAGTPQAVQGLLDEVWPRALAALAREREALDAERRESGVPEHEPLQAWDWRYWAERVRQRRYAVDDAEVKPYFPLPAVVAAAFDCAQRLFGLVFTRRDDLPVYHPDVVAYEVNRADGTPVGLFLQDNFARAGKRSGAWMSSLRWQHRNAADASRAGSAISLPIILNNNNFARGAPGEPTLLSLDDARTLFHEFGHGLHGLLSDVTYRRLSGTQVLRDFVELPSQIFEHWIQEREVLQRHARHFRSGEPIPDALIDRLQQARRFNQGYETVRYCASTLIDQAVHARADAEPPADLCAFERDWLRAQGLPDEVGQNHRLVHFQHLFSSSAYAAGYYVYLWAEVLDADGYDAFVEAGSPFAPEVAARLQRHIYAAGSRVAPQETYVAFRGRPAAVQPLLKKRGLLDEVPA
jgi:peptidyl-dipeptidase Dcp